MGYLRGGYQRVPGKMEAPALQVLWQAVTSNPMDFQSWTALLSQVEEVLKQQTVSCVVWSRTLVHSTAR